MAEASSKRSISFITNLLFYFHYIKNDNQLVLNGNDLLQRVYLTHKPKERIISNNAYSICFRIGMIEKGHRTEEIEYTAGKKSTIMREKLKT
jgi:hypothetical protein